MIILFNHKTHKNNHKNVNVHGNKIKSKGAKMYNFNGNIVERQESQQVLERFKQFFIDDNYPERILMINHLNKIEKKLPIEELRDVDVPRTDNIYIYHERLQILYLTNFEQICIYINQLEPWEDVDCLVFDESFTWFIGITHNESLLLSGI